MDRTDWFQKFHGKRVLLLGGGESAFDIGHVLTQYVEPNNLYYSTKDYIEWFPTGGESSNIIKQFDKNSFLYKLYKLQINPTDTKLLGVEYSLPEPMSHFWHEYGRHIVYSFISEKYDSNKCTHHLKKLCDINETPNNLFKKYVVKRDEFLLDLYDNKATIVYYPSKIENNIIYTKELELTDIDIIVCASGFKKDFPFLESTVYNDEMIKKMIPKNTKNIAFIGYARPTMGSIAAVTEMQSWWVKLYFENKLNYTIRKPWFRTVDPLNLSNEHINTLVIGCFYIKDLAKDMNLEPNMLYLLFTDITLFKYIYFGSCHPMIYRIQGQKYTQESRDILLNTFPKYYYNPYIFYYLFFIVLHLIFIIFIIVMLYALCKLFNFKIDKYFYILCLFILYMFYS